MISMTEIDTMIDSAIGRLSTSNGSSVSYYYIDLKKYQTRITNKLVSQCIFILGTRGIYSERQGDGLSVTIDLNKCSFNPSQSNYFNAALSHAMIHHENDV